jgi:hypothetical protein
MDPPGSDWVPASVYHPPGGKAHILKDAMSPAISRVSAVWQCHSHFSTDHGFGGVASDSSLWYHQNLFWTHARAILLKGAFYAGLRK